MQLLLSAWLDDHAKVCYATVNQSMRTARMHRCKTYNTSTAPYVKVPKAWCHVVWGKNE